ncbi:MAG: hypothetical protein AB7O97_09370 [Planctomycetota bacterium]
MCLDACSLGCRGTTCEITDIAQNEIVVLRFSQALDPSSVNNATIQFRTAGGEEPEGTFLVNGNVVEFVPRPFQVGTQTFFGFQSGETYSMTLPAGPGQVTLRSTSGDALNQEISCTMRVSRGIIDHNGVAPRAELLLPTSTVNVARDQVVQVRFNELVDVTPFVGATPSNGPVTFAWSGSVAVGGTRVCNPAEQPLSGAIDVTLLPELPATLVTFTPATQLPATSCIRVTVSDRVRDLSGRAADLQTFEFQTIEVPAIEIPIVENFDDDTMLDRARSAGSWSGGVATFAAIGGDGRHGSFDLATMAQFVGTQGSEQVYRVDTNNTPIPASSSLSGVSTIVNDGRYFFSDFTVPANVRLQFVGNAPPIVTVRGRIDVRGTIDIRGESVPHPVITTSTSGPGRQDGGLGGVFGGNGGNGGTRNSPTVGSTAVNNGQNGGDCRVAAGHAFQGQVLNTGGRGSVVFPIGGRGTSLVLPSGTGYALQSSAGGGGGGLLVPGGQGLAVSNPALNTAGDTRPDFLGPPAAGGVALPALLPVPGGVKSSLHLVVGGSGGGGGASHPLAMFTSLASSSPWPYGQAGAGGGGAIALRAGDELLVATGAGILASGGSAGSSTAVSGLSGTAAPGGGGSGGSILLQSGNFSRIQGLVDWRGGAGGILAQTTALSPPAPPPNGGAFRCEGGAGSNGVLRLEVPGTPSAALLPNSQPVAGAANVGPLVETDTRVGFQSLFYSTERTSPQFLRYVIRARLNGQAVTFSDDPSLGVPARPGFGPFEVFFQGVRIDLVTGVIDQADLVGRPWRTTVGGVVDSLATDSRNAFRFLLLLDRTGGQTVEVDSIEVVFSSPE